MTYVTRQSFVYDCGAGGAEDQRRQPIVAEPAAQQAEEAAMTVMDQFFDAYRTYDMDKMLSLHTDDAVSTWIDPGKNFPDFGPEGKMVGTGKDEMRAMFDFDRGEAGFSGYISTCGLSTNSLIHVNMA